MWPSFGIFGTPSIQLRNTRPVERLSFSDTKIIQDAVARNLEIIGEAVKNLSPGLRTRHPAVPWQQIAGLRDVLIHQYFGVNLELVWQVVEHRLPELRKHVESLVEEET